MITKTKDSLKGGASSHLRPCKVTYCDKHNERLDEHPSNKNIRPEYSENNTIWKDPDYPSLPQLDRQIRNDYFKHHGRHMPDRGPSKASPLKESVTLLPNGDKSTDDMEKRLIARLEKEFGIRCVRAFIHRDEYCDETGEFNWHAHEVFDMYDHVNHRMILLSRADCRKWQDIVAEETGMPRGNPAYETRRKWLSANDYKLKKQNEAIREKEKIEAELDSRIREKEEKLSKTAGNPIARMIAGVSTRMQGNYTAEEVAKMMAKKDADTDERARAIQEEADNKVNALQDELIEERNKLKQERDTRRERIKEAEEKAARKKAAEMRAQAHDYIAKHTGELERQLAEAQSENEDLRKKMEKVLATNGTLNIVARSLLDMLRNDNVGDSTKHDVLALFSDHMDEDGRKTISRLLKHNGIGYPLWTSSELAKYRERSRITSHQSKNNYRPKV